MKRIGLAVLGLVGLVALCFVLALLLVDGEDVRDAIGARLEAILGEPVELGAVELSLFPLPAARIRDARIGDPSAPRIEAREVRVTVSLPALLVGKVVLRSLELEAPRLRMGAPSAAAPSGTRWNERAAESVTVAITRLAVREGTLDAGTERLEEIEVSGGLDLSLGATLGFSAEIPGVGRIDDGVLEVDGLAGPAEEWHWTASAQLDGLDLAGLQDRTGVRALYGKATGKLDAEGRGARTERASLELESQDLDARGALVQVSGPTRLDVRYPERSLDVDLTGAQLGVGKLVQKPSGVELRASAKRIELADAALLLHELRVDSAALRAAGELELRAGAPALELSRATFDLKALASWTGPAWMPRTGRLELEDLRLAGSPPAVRAAGELSDVQIEVLPGVAPTLSGAVFADGTTLGCDALTITYAGESITASARYDWLAGQIQLAASAGGTRVKPVLEEAAKYDNVSGRLYANIELTGPLDLYGLTGKGEFELRDGEWRGLTLARAVIREPAPELFERDDPLEALRGRFEVEGDEVHIHDVVIDQAYAQARLSGDLFLRDFTIDGTGEVTIFSPELSEPAVIPVLKVGGTLANASMMFGNAETEDLRKVEATMIEEFRKAERAYREREKEERSKGGASSDDTSGG